MTRVIQLNQNVAPIDDDRGVGEGDGNGNGKKERFEVDSKTIIGNVFSVLGEGNIKTENIHKLKEVPKTKLGENFREMKEWLRSIKGLKEGEAYKQYLIGFEKEDKKDLYRKVLYFRPDGEIATSISGPAYYYALHDAILARVSKKG